VRLTGILKEEEFIENISAIAIRDNVLLVGSDEVVRIQIPKRQDNLHYEGEPQHTVSLNTSEERSELDIEGITFTKKHFRVIGFHSRIRRTTNADKRDVKKDLKRLREIAVQPAREYLFRSKLDPEVNLVPDSIKSVSLRNIIINDRILAPFQVTPAKKMASISKV
jgi:hypothetical protein